MHDDRLPSQELLPNPGQPARAVGSLVPAVPGSRYGPLAERLE